MKEIKIEQLDENGNVYRTFTHYRRDDEVEEKLERIERAYNMNRTRVTVS